MVNQPNVEPDIAMKDEEYVPNISSGGMFVPMHKYQTSRETEITLPDSQYHSSCSSRPNCDFLTKSFSQFTLMAKSELLFNEEFNQSLP